MLTIFAEIDFKISFMVTLTRFVFIKVYPEIYGMDIK